MGHFTLDNASNNKTAMEELSLIMAERDIHFDPVDHRILCFPHIINLCAKHIIDEYPTADFSGLNDEWMVGEDTIVKGEYVEAMRGNPLKRARAVVTTIRGSHSRRTLFNKIIAEGNRLGKFVPELPEVELLCDVKTRWDSVYVMINRLLKLRPVRFHPSKYSSLTNRPRLSKRSSRHMINVT
jgi:hypothetical protein